jgi:hypothetical protein
MLVPLFNFGSHWAFITRFRLTTIFLLKLLTPDSNLFPKSLFIDLSKFSFREEYVMAHVVENLLVQG